MRGEPVKDVDVYIAQAVPFAQPILRELRRLIKEAKPQAEETIKWSLPFYLFEDKKASIAAYKAHVSFSVSENLPEQLRQKAERSGYETGQKRINIGFNQPVPVNLLQEILFTI
ncbi:hypothetical protein NRIC_29180 [Enterococcus florum]|uniref:YdhG-like domain-containing protein n=1 Tax=Enterococcus florum TaxID=2480627 RepID=A0A4P5PAB0_9ENTE|nr:DUF1801 domain-containing protein [Enterococcus florum]GCF95027.1 hypothetical protein NRIC_29180 [Enterococcus florum]